MRTILVTYTNRDSLTSKEIRGAKLYCFNTEDDLKVGDRISSESYTTNMLVVKALETSFKYYNSVTGTLSNEFTSSLDREIATLVIRENATDVIYGTLIKEA